MNGPGASRRFSLVTTLIGLVVLAGSILVATPEAHAQDGALCTFNPTNGRLSPGVTMTPTKGRWSTGPSSFDCQGTVNGQPVTGPGTIVESGPFDGSCSHGSGSGVLTITIPTAKGTVHLDVPITFSWMGGAGVASAPGMTAVFEFMPTEGDCVSTPVTGYRQWTQVLLTT